MQWNVKIFWRFRGDGNEKSKVFKPFKYLNGQNEGVIRNIPSILLQIVERNSAMNASLIQYLMPISITLNRQLNSFYCVPSSESLIPVYRVNSSS